MGKYKTSEGRLSALTGFKEEDKRISEELLGPLYFKSRKPGYEGKPVPALDFKAYMKYVSEKEHSRMYEEAVYIDRNLAAPEWKELPEEEKARIRQINNDYKKSMQDFGEMISSGATPKL